MAVMFYCQWCNKKFNKHEANVRIEDNTFSAPFGNIKVAVGGSIDKIETCQYCGEDLEEVEE